MVKKINRSENLLGKNGIGWRPDFFKRTCFSSNHSKKNLVVFDQFGVFAIPSERMGI